MKQALLLLCCFWVGLLIAKGQTTQLEKRKLLNGRMELLVPVGFGAMSKEMLALKYPGSQPPQDVLTDERGATNVAFSLTTTPITQENLPYFEQHLYAIMQKAQPKAIWYGHGIQKINNRQVGYLELMTPAVDTEVYNLMFFTDLDGRVLMMTFNCIKKDLALWKGKAQEMMRSLRVLYP